MQQLLDAYKKAGNTTRDAQLQLLKQCRDALQKPAVVNNLWARYLKKFTAKNGSGGDMSAAAEAKKREKDKKLHKQQKLAWHLFHLLHSRDCDKSNCPLLKCKEVE